MKDATLLERAQTETSEVKEQGGLSASQPVSYEPDSWTKRGIRD